MATEAELAARIESLEAALATGVLTVRHGMTETTFRSEEEIRRIILHLQHQISAPPRVRYVMQTTKGL
jgi:hypothetical protein